MQLIAFSVLMIALVFLKLFIHTVAGVLWWTPGEWFGSFIFNLPIYGVTLAVCLPVSIIIYRPMQKVINQQMGCDA
jgi:thiamine transporter ThiT